MNIRTASVLIACLMALSLVEIAIGQTTKATGVPKLPGGWKFTFPDGDSKAGQTVFMNMQCYSCHAMKIPGEKIPSGTGETGPDLTGYSVLPKEYLAESLIKSHTVVAAPGYAVKAGKAAMGNYNHFMTIQEMIDLVAFLKQHK